MNKIKPNLTLIILALLIFICSVYNNPLFAEEVESKGTYIIKEGDTLWDISSDKLDDSFQWPNIWKENPQINNPDKVYPGQVIAIPADVTQKIINLRASKRTAEQTKESVSEVNIAPQILPDPIVDKELLYRAGYIVKDKISSGKIVGDPSERQMFGRHDSVYVETDTEHFDKYYIVNYKEKIKHPKTGKQLGYLVEIAGVLKIDGTEAGYKKGVIIKNFKEASIGDLLIPYYEIEAPRVERVERSTVNGTIVAINSIRMLGGELDLVYTDMGASKGVTPGDIYTTYSGESPKRPIGKLLIISTRQETSAGYMISSNYELAKGDTF